MFELTLSGVIATITDKESVTPTLQKQILVLSEDTPDPTLEPRILPIEFLQYTQQNGTVRDYTAQLADFTEGSPVTVYCRLQGQKGEKGYFTSVKGIRVVSNA